ncbi:hypothetical protein [Pseudooceanicola sp. LIPI14-2-Ac024]|uniref:hypothetical protein n=1 Tax=Pseudooceanicola sp. LIPI14-2-Ac024 TaxID=3344875 RepID=UPI0035D10F1A
MAADAARCAALWYGMVDAGARYPGLLPDTTNARTLAEGFAAMAGPGAADRIAQDRPGMELLVRGYLAGDAQSVRLFETLATTCARISGD